MRDYCHEQDQETVMKLTSPVVAGSSHLLGRGIRGHSRKGYILIASTLLIKVMIIVRDDTIDQVPTKF